MAKKKRHAPLSPVTKALTTISLIGWSFLVILLCFVSLDLGILAGGILALCSFYILEGHRHKNWDNALQKTLAHLRQSQSHSKEQLQQHDEDIAMIKTQLAGLRAVHGNNQKDNHITPPNENIIPAMLRPQTMDNTAEKIEPAAVTPVANDEPFAKDDSLSDLVVRELLHTAIEKHKIDIFMQPIVRLPQRQLRFYEMFARIRAKPGIYLPASRYMSIASKESLMIPIDKLLLMQSLRILQKNRNKQRASGFFLNIKPEILKNQDFMQRLIQFVSQNRTLAPALIFEIKQEDFENLPTGEHKILDALAKLGCRYSLDHVTDMPDDIAGLQQKNIRFIKLSTNHMLSEADTDKRFTKMMRRKRILEANGIGVIVEKIENEKDLLEVLDYNINYGQGYLFGRPAIEDTYKVQNVG